METPRTLAYIGAVLLILSTILSLFVLRSQGEKAQEAGPQPSPTLVSSPQPTPEPVTLVFGGDVMLGRFVETQLRRYGASWVTESIAPVFAAADVRVVNLESPFRVDGLQTANGSLVFRADPSAVEVLKLLNISVVSLANNHITDMGVQGLRDTKQVLNQAGIGFTGAAESAAETLVPAFYEVKGQRFGFLSATYGVNFDSNGVFYATLEEGALTAAVRELKQDGVVPIVLLHWGTEYQAKPSNAQVALARALHEAGALLVIGAHPHVPQGIQQFGEGYTFYSLGNLIFDQDQGSWRDQSALVKVVVEAGEVLGYELVPYRIESYAKPVLATGAEADQIKERFTGN